MNTILYLCDGKACEAPNNCYVRGGLCYHTTNYNHSIKRNKGRDFPSTTLVNMHGTIVEKIAKDSDGDKTSVFSIPETSLSHSVDHDGDAKIVISSPESNNRG